MLFSSFGTVWVIGSAIGNTQARTSNSPQASWPYWAADFLVIPFWALSRKWQRSGTYTGRYSFFLIPLPDTFNWRSYELSGILGVTQNHLSSRLGSCSIPASRHVSESSTITSLNSTTGRGSVRLELRNWTAIPCSVNCWFWAATIDLKPTRGALLSGCADTKMHLSFSSEGCTRCVLTSRAETQGS
jgi:hypothetical protein